MQNELTIVICNSLIRAIILLLPRFELFNSGIVTLHYDWSVHDVSMDPVNELDMAGSLASVSKSNPFLVKPIMNEILPGQSAQIEVSETILCSSQLEGAYNVTFMVHFQKDFTVKFSLVSTLNTQVLFEPLRAGQYRALLQAHLPNCQSGPNATEATHTITLTGLAEQPFVHFDLHNSDYLTGNRRDPDLPGPAGLDESQLLDSTTRVIELSSVGVGTRCIR